MEQPSSKRERGISPEEQQRRVGALLWPENAEEAKVLFIRIEELVYGGAGTQQERVTNAQRRGYSNTQDLQKKGAEIVLRYHQLRSALDGAQRVPIPRRQEFQQLETLVVDSRSKERDAVTIGIAKELRRQIGKFIKASILDEPEKQADVIRESDVMLSGLDVELFITLREDNPQALKSHMATVFQFLADKPAMHKRFAAASAVLLATLTAK